MKAAFEADFAELLHERGIDVSPTAYGSVLQPDRRPSVDPELMIRMLLIGY